MTVFTNFNPRFSKLKTKAIVLIAFVLCTFNTSARSKIYLLLNEGDCNNCNRIPNEIIKKLKENSIENFEIIVSNPFSKKVVAKKFNLDLSLLHVSKKKHRFSQSAEGRSTLVIVNDKKVVYNEPLIFAIDDTPNWLHIYFSHSTPRLVKTLTLKLKSSDIYNWIQTNNHYTKEFILIHSPFLNTLTIIKNNQIIDSSLTDLIQGKGEKKGLLSENYLSAHLKDSFNYFIFSTENDSIILLKTDTTLTVKESFTLPVGFYAGYLGQSQNFRINPNPFWGNGFFVDTSGGILFQVYNPNMSKNYVTDAHKDSFKPNVAKFKLTQNALNFDTFLFGELPNVRIEEKKGYFNHFVIFENNNGHSYLIADYGGVFYNAGKFEETNVPENSLTKSFIDYGLVKLSIEFNSTKRLFILKKDFLTPVKRFKKRANQSINFSQGKIIETSYQYITKRARIQLYEIKW